MADVLAGIALLISILGIAYTAGGLGQRVKSLEGRADAADLAREKLRDRVDGLATKDDLKQMEARIEDQLKSRFDTLIQVISGPK